MKAVEIDGKVRIQMADGSLLCDERGIPLWFPSITAAERVIERGGVKKIETRGVVDNRHRNWRRRQR